MFKKNVTTTIIRRRNARRYAMEVCARLRTEALSQGLSFPDLRRSTGLGVRASIRLWFSANPPAWAIERTREVLGLSIEQVWAVR